MRVPYTTQKIVKVERWGKNKVDMKYNYLGDYKVTLEWPEQTRWFRTTLPAFTRDYVGRGLIYRHTESGIRINIVMANKIENYIWHYEYEKEGKK